PAETVDRLNLKSIPANESLASWLSLQPEEVRIQALSTFSPRELSLMEHDWRGFWARPKQLQPGTTGAADTRADWTYWLALAGRGWGKTRVGAETVREWASQPLPGAIHLVAPIAGDIRKVMIE